MNNNSKQLLSYAFSALLIAVLFFGCKQKTQQLVTKTPGKAYYTCSMHPQVHEEHPGNCPICGMKLIKVELTGSNDNTALDKITLTATQIQLAAVQT
ncbi:MAG: efflux transporter periplasmic adaptor subunit, partial [Mucilaginibacter sp.]|nr:efflux transporter periplasmic adaptor subunit [Mucilaginibacter sp.]